MTAHAYVPAQDERGRVRWTCTCGSVGHWRAKRPYLAWRRAHRAPRGVSVYATAVR